MSYLVGVPDMGVIPVIGVVVSDSFLESFFIWAWSLSAWKMSFY